MKNSLWLFTAIFSAGISAQALAFDEGASALATQSSANNHLAQIEESCRFAQVSFTAQFEAARLNGCKQVSSNSYELSIDAENRPVNPSPWYAFIVEPGTKPNNDNGANITISIQAVDASPRYLPKVQNAKGDWDLLDFTVANNAITFALAQNNLPLKVAAQAIINNDDYQKWTDSFSKKGLYEKVLLGQSSEGRPIYGLIKQHKNNHEWLLLVGRQHPPEVTGAIAFLHFAEQMNEPNEQLDAFYQRFNVLMVPAINPDGIASGNWRHNNKGADLNRDWGKFEHIETKVVNDYLRKLLAPATPNASNTGQALKAPKLVFALDFHSTQQDIFYTMPNDYHVAPALFADQWIEEIKANTVSSFTVRNRPGSRPDNGVFKQFIADTYHVHAVTYEVGDNTPNSLIRHVAHVSANTLVTKMLATPSEEFIYLEPAQ